MKRWYSVRYQPRTTVMWVAATAIWWVAAVVNLVLVFTVGSLIAVVLAIITALAAVAFTALLPFTRRAQEGEATQQGDYLVVREQGPWWRRVSLGGSLRLRVQGIERTGGATALVTGADPFWGTMRLRFTLEGETEAQEVMKALEGLRRPRGATP
ncbi:MAG: hypothetical protein HY686_05625 [Chloroflexi bacterium]|nr:hypothetical protein [Chloroflexota bacterium]